MQKAIITLIGLLSLSLIPVCIAETTKSADGWKPLFNGHDLSDFELVQGAATYSLKEGIITGRTAVGSPNTFLATKNVYGDFELKFEVKVDDALNSGVQIRSLIEGREAGDLGEGTFWGPQVEIEASPGQSGYVWGESLGTGWFSENPRSDDPEVNQHSVFKNGQWNQYHIIAKGPNLKIYINDTLVDELTLPKEIHNRFSKGHIGLQVHSIPDESHPLEVHWRNLYIKEL